MKKIKWPPLKSFFKTGDLLFEDKQKAALAQLFQAIGRACYGLSFCAFAAALSIFMAIFSGFGLGRRCLCHCSIARQLGPQGPLLVFAHNRQIWNFDFFGGL